MASCQLCSIELTISNRDLASGFCTTCAQKRASEEKVQASDERQKAIVRKRQERDAMYHAAVATRGKNASMVAAIKSSLKDKSSEELRASVLAGSGSRWSTEAIVAMQQILAERDSTDPLGVPELSTVASGLLFRFASLLVCILRGLSGVSFIWGCQNVRNALKLGRQVGRFSGVNEAREMAFSATSTSLHFRRKASRGCQFAG